MKDGIKKYHGLTHEEEVFGGNCDLGKVLDSFKDGIEDYEVNGETGQTEDIWDYICDREGAIQ